MRIVLFSNFINHHQIPLAEALNSIPGVEYIFVATTPFDSVRAAMGYQDVNSKYDYVLRSYESKGAELQAYRLAKESDIAMVGSAPDSFLTERLENGRVTFRTSERYFKKRFGMITFPRYFASAMKHIRPYQNKPLYYLCASAYTVGDVNMFANYRNCSFKWGYFPETKRYEIKELFAKKDRSKILWVGRFLDWKHADDALRIANRLKSAGYAFSMDFVGSGEMERQLKKMTKKYDVTDCVNFLGPVPSDQVRSHMEKAGIYLFTSDRYEGWGAVLNESMNSGCAVVASHAIGSVPYLMNDNKNGLVYRSGNVDELYEKVKCLLDHPEKQDRLGRAAYETITSEWNAEIAAERLVDLSVHLLAGEKNPDLYPAGPCSRAEIIKDDWF